MNASGRRANDVGFTLIEILIVIIVLGVLVGIVLLSLGTFKGDSNTAACEADLRHVQTAATAYLARNDSWPTDLSDLSSYLQTTTFPAEYHVAVGTQSTGATATC